MIESKISRAMRKPQKPGFSQYFSSPNSKTRRNPVSWPISSYLTQKFDREYLPKLHRDLNPVHAVDIFPEMR